MDTIETVVFWALAIWSPGLLLMAYLMIPRGRQQAD